MGNLLLFNLNLYVVHNKERHLTYNILVTHPVDQFTSNDRRSSDLGSIVLPSGRERKTLTIQKVKPSKTINFPNKRKVTHQGLEPLTY